mmetsp:Transcript_74624/g.218601  ORF Transcript_74624/g.218601 Transcript_74624/m.218601 type:complete len:333 (+) Transcript_74624:1275-2273(+)
MGGLHLRLVVPYGDHAEEPPGGGARAPGGDRGALHCGRQRAIRFLTPVQGLEVLQGIVHRIPLPPHVLAKLIQPGHLPQTPRGGVVGVLAVDHLDPGAMHRGVPQDILLQLWQPLLHALLDPTMHCVGHDADRAELLRRFQHVDGGVLELLHRVLHGGLIGQRVVEPARDLVSPVHVVFRVGARRELCSLLPVLVVRERLLEQASDPRRRAQGVVPVEKDDGAPVGKCRWQVLLGLLLLSPLLVALTAMEEPRGQQLHRGANHLSIFWWQQPHLLVQWKQAAVVHLLRGLVGGRARRWTGRPQLLPRVRLVGARGARRVARGRLVRLVLPRE